MSLSAQQIVSKAKVALMNDAEWRWMASIYMMGTTTFTDDDGEVPTAATDGLNEVYNTKFLAELSGEQVKFVVLHENFHKMFRHLFVWRSLFEEDAELANVACDVIVNNQYLKNKVGIKPIDGGVDMPQYADPDVWNTRKVFDDLKKKGMGQSDKMSGSPKAGGRGKGSDIHQWEKAGEATPEEVKDIEKQIDGALRQAAIAGNIGSNMPRSVTEMLVPEVDWQTLLAEFVKTSCAGLDKQTWRRPHKTYLAYDLYTPAPYSEATGKILLGGDTSGSIDAQSLNVFLGHMQHLCNEVKPSGVDIAWWDTQVRSVDVIDMADIGSLSTKVKPAGGGGTDPSCIPEWIKKENKNGEYVCAVIITDGEFYGAVGDWGDLPVLWLVVNNHAVSTIPVGITVQVKEIR